MDDFNTKVEIAALEGAASRKQTLAPLVAEAVDNARRVLSETQQAIEVLPDCNQWKSTIPKSTAVQN